MVKARSLRARPERARGDRVLLGTTVFGEGTAERQT
jgi:hypothetical protein